MRARCFSPEDRLLLAERVRKNDTGIQNKDFKVCLPVFVILEGTDYILTDLQNHQAGE